MLLSGIGMGTVFDGYRVVSSELKFPRWWLPVLDIVYWMAAAIAVFRVLYASNYGEVRAYVFIGLAVGVLLYYFLLSKSIMALVKWSIGAVRKLVAFTMKCLHILVVKPILLLYRLLVVTFGFGSAITIFLFKIMLQLVRPFWLLIAWMLRPALRPLGRMLMPYWQRLKLSDRLAHIGQIISRLWGRWFRR